jgi:hypothetical protein
LKLIEAGRIPVGLKANPVLVQAVDQRSAYPEPRVLLVLAGPSRLRMGEQARLPLLFLQAFVGRKT